MKVKVKSLIALTAAALAVTSFAYGDPAVNDASSANASQMLSQATTEQAVAQSQDTGTAASSTDTQNNTTSSNDEGSTDTATGDDDY